MSLTLTVYYYIVYNYALVQKVQTDYHHQHGFVLEEVFSYVAEAGLGCAMQSSIAYNL